ncbi:MAG TPA: polyphosphate kinase 1 [Firmicutes bacterium]|nr:polyphosphate kinase 1 [Bacillota bacterium]
MAERPPRVTQNRELSWLRFNQRVLEEAMDESVPLLERLKFVAIFTSNLDEFFMIRVGSLHDLAAVDSGTVDKKSGMTYRQQLSAIYAAVGPLIACKDRVWAGLRKQLAQQGVWELSMGEAEKREQKYLKQYFAREVDPILSPQIVDSHHPFPHFANKLPHVGALLRDKRGEVFGVIPLPASLPQVLFLPGAQARYVSLPELLLAQMGKVFRNYEVVEKTLFCVTRNADITPHDESFALEGDFRARMRKLLRSRTKLAPVRLELGSPVSGRFRDYFCRHLGLTRAQVYTTASPMRMDYVFSLADKLPPALRAPLTYPPFTPQPPAQLTPGESVLRQVLRRDVLLSYPYESMEPFLRLIREAAGDPEVISIKIAIYRLARRAKLVDYLCAAAENGKDVTVLIELRARFDEQNNIDWSQRLEEAGCRILYGFDGYKVHAKVCLITRRDRSGVSYITQVGTGNYNEKTAAQYTDLAYLTAHPGIGADAAAFFKNLAIGNLEGTYRHLLVAPHELKRRLLGLIDREMAKGSQGYIFLKMNALTDLELIRKLCQASQAGVRVELIVRGICCLLPGVEGESEHIQVTSIVGRYLEHARIYLFGRGQEELLYLSSADFMTRNMERRVEVACPIRSRAAREAVHRIIQAQRMDNTKARRLGTDGQYRPVSDRTGVVNCHDVLMREAEEAAAKLRTPVQGEGLRRLLRRLLGRGKAEG